MSDTVVTDEAPGRTVRSSRLATALLVVSLAVPVATLTFEAIRIGAGGGTASLDVGLWLVPFAVAVLGVVGWMILRRTANAIGWVFLAMAIGVELALVGEAYVGASLETGWSLSPVLLWVTDALAWPAAALTITLLFLLFPTGRLPSPRWRPVLWAWAGGAALSLLWSAIEPYAYQSPETPAIPNPFFVDIPDPVRDALAIAGLALSLTAALAAIVGLTVRYRRAHGEERAQMRWLVLVASAAGSLLLLMLVGAAIVGFGEEPGGVLDAVDDVLWFTFVILLLVGVPAAVAIGVLKYRLYDIDIVVRKTVVVGTLVVFTTAVYVVAAVIVQRFATDQGTTVAFVAGLVVALAFGPVRRFARRVADRMVYGARATPYEVLTAFGDRVGEGYSVDDVIPRMVALLAEGTGASVARVWLRVGDELRPVASWPTTATTTRPLPAQGDELPPFEAEDLFPVRHQGELLGAISVAFPPGDPITPAKARLVEDLAAQAGLVLRNVRLVEDLRASRKRLVAAQDQERRRLERNIHDGAQQQLVALAVKLGLLEQLASRDPTKAAELASELKADATTALEDLRDTARGIYPPLLADRGLAAALEAQARKSPVAVAVIPDGVERYGQDVESAVYFCCLEALQNVAKYAHASHAEIRLSSSPGQVAFVVADDGDGFDPNAVPHGSGLQGMTDRLEAIGGTLEIRSRPGAGTTVTGRVPVGES
jgi:signal transduction histidine kinase